MSGETRGAKRLASPSRASVYLGAPGRAESRKTAFAHSPHVRPAKHAAIGAHASRRPNVSAATNAVIPRVLKTHESDLLAEWMREQMSAFSRSTAKIKEADLRQQA